MTQYTTPSLPGLQSPYPNLLQTTFTTVGPQVDAITIPLTPLTVLGDRPPPIVGPPTPGWPADRSPWAPLTDGPRQLRRYSAPLQAEGLHAAPLRPRVLSLSDDPNAPRAVPTSVTVYVPRLKETLIFHPPRLGSPWPASLPLAASTPPPVPLVSVPVTPQPPQALPAFERTYAAATTFPSPVPLQFRSLPALPVTPQTIPTTQPSPLPGDLSTPTPERPLSTSSFASSNPLDGTATDTPPGEAEVDADATSQAGSDAAPKHSPQPPAPASLPNGLPAGPPQPPANATPASAVPPELANFWVDGPLLVHRYFEQLRGENAVLRHDVARLTGDLAALRAEVQALQPLLQSLRPDAPAAATPSPPPTS
eukprot:EG_transcript_12373